MSIAMLFDRSLASLQRAWGTCLTYVGLRPK